MMLPLKIQTAALRVHAKAWTAAYRLLRNRRFLRWAADYANSRRCWYLRAWYANYAPDYGAFCAAVEALRGGGMSEHASKTLDGAKNTATERRRPLTDAEREWLKRFPKFDENADPFEQMTKLAAYMDEGFNIGKGK